MLHYNFLSLDDVAFAKQTVLIREDFNVPVANGVVTSDLRIRAALPGIEKMLAAQAKIIIMSHLGRPTAGAWQEDFSLQPVAACLQILLDRPVTFVKEWSTRESLPDAQIIVLENVRFLPGETENSPILAQKMADLADVFVMDAFGSAHRAHASTVGVIEFAKIAVAGPLLLQEINALQQIMRDPRRPLVAVIGGAKISSKLAMLESLIKIVDKMLIGGGMANTLLAAQGHAIGNSLHEEPLIPDALRILNAAKAAGCEIVLPVDVVTHNGAQKSITNIAIDDQIMDIGSASIELFAQHINTAATVIWNGPMGVFGQVEFANGTQQIAECMAHCKAFTVVGGGDTLAAIDKFNLIDEYSYVSTGGGAFLEYIEGKQLPTLAALANKTEAI